MIPANLPDYVDRGGRQVWRPPYTARDTEVFGFVVECRRESIDRLLRRDLVEPSDGAVDYRCARECVAVLFARIGRLASADHRDSLRGYVSELEVSVWCLAADVAADNHLVWYLPYVFVDSGQAAASGREVYGYPKQMAVFQSRFPERLADAGTTTTVRAQAIARYDPDAEATLQPMIAATRSPEAGRPPGGGIEDLVGHVVTGLAVDDTLPYGERPRQSAAITAVDAPPPGPARRPAWAARRLLDTFSGRRLERMPEDVVASMITSPMLVFLKQFRDVTCPRKACYQAIVEAPLAVHADGASTYEQLDASVFRLQFFDYDSHPVASDIGVRARESLEPEFAFHATFDFDIALGDEVWRAST